MSYTLADFIRDWNAPDLVQRTNIGDLDQIPIHSVSVQEFPLGDFIREHELVLSTAIGCDRDPSLFLAIVDAALQARAAALLFTFSGAAFRIPEEAVVKANAGGLPILEAPWASRFSDIQAMVYQALEQERQQFWNTLQNQLCNLFFESGSLDQACAILSNTFSGACMIESVQGRILGSSGAPIALLSQKETASFQEEITVRGTALGRLYLWGDTAAADMNAANDHVRRSVLFPLSLWFNQRIFEDVLRERMKNEFVCSLATGDYDSYEKLVQQSVYLHFDLSLPYTCILLRAVSPEEEDAEARYSTRVIERRTEVEQMLLSEAHRMHRRIMVGYLNQCHLIYLENAPEDRAEPAYQFALTCDADIPQIWPELRLYWGISETLQEAAHFDALYRHAAMALRYAMAPDAATRVFTYHETRKAFIISCLTENPEMQETAQAVIGPLLAYDQSSSMNLLETLTCYLDSNYNISLTARRLHIHRQTLLYRLARIAELTGMRLDEHDNLFVLEVFSRIYRNF